MDVIAFTSGPTRQLLNSRTDQTAGSASFLMASWQQCILAVALKMGATVQVSQSRLTAFFHFAHINGTSVFKARQEHQTHCLAKVRISLDYSSRLFLAVFVEVVLM